MTHRPNAITYMREYTVLPGVVRHTFIIFGLFTTPNLCPPDTKSWRRHCAYQWSSFVSIVLGLQRTVDCCTAQQRHIWLKLLSAGIISRMTTIISTDHLQLQPATVSYELRLPPVLWHDWLRDRSTPGLKTSHQQSQGFVFGPHGLSGRIFGNTVVKHKPQVAHLHCEKMERMQTKNSAVADKPRDAFVQMQRRGWPKNTPLSICYHAEFGRFALNGIIYR